MRWILIVFVGIMLVGCDEPKDFSKDYKTRKIVDSIFRKERVLVDSQMAVQCTVKTNKLLNGMVDSILIVRRQEVEEILRREALKNAKTQ